MANSLTPNLKLIVDDSLTSSARYNLNRIDSLAASSKTENTGSLRIRSLRDIVLKPESEDLGGAGSGGSVSVGETGANLDSVDFYADSIDFHSAVLTGFTLGAGSITDAAISPAAAINATKIAAGNVSNTEFGYLDGVTSPIQAQINAISGTNQLAAPWLNADGTSLLITHNFGTQNVLIQVLDTANNYATVDVQTVTRPTINTAQLTASEAPSTSWIVLLTQVGT